MDAVRVIAAALVIGVAGCGQSEKPAAAPPPSPPPTTASASPSDSPGAPVVLSTEQGRTRFRELDDKWRKAYKRFAALHNASVDSPGSADLPEVTEAAVDLVDASRAHARSLLAEDWPRNVRPRIRALTRKLSRLIAPIRGMSEADSWSEYDDFSRYMEPVAFDLAADVEEVKQLLGVR